MNITRAIPALILFVTVAVSAQSVPEQTYTTPGFLKPWTWEGRNGDLERGAATPAEVKQLEAQMLALRNLLAAVPAAGKPTGYNTMLSGRLESFDAPDRPELKAKDFPLSALIWFGAFPQEFDAQGKLLPELGETELMSFTVNRLPNRIGKPAEWRDQTTDIGLQPRELPAVAGQPRFGDMLVVRNGARPLWLPVSVERAYRLILAQRHGVVAGYEKKAAEMRRDYADWIDPAKRSERKKNYELAARVQSDPAAAMARFEKLDTDTAEIRRKQAEAMNPSVNYWADAIAKVQEAEADYAALSPERKAEPACYLAPPLARNAVTRPQAILVPVGTANCRPVVRPNWDYFDRAAPRSALQLLTVWVRDCPEKKAPRDGDPAGCPANLALLRGLDWEKVKGLLTR